MDKKLENRLALILILLFSAIITGIIIYQNCTHSLLGHSYRDVFFYLIESLRFSGVEITGYSYVNYLSPFIPFLTSILFRMGFVSESSIFITSGVFFFIAIMGMFYLLKLRFSNNYALFGAVIYGTLIINVKWVANGTLDIPFVALMIWALYFFIQGMEKNQKYFYLAFPLAVLSFFTKYPAALIGAVMLLYFMSKPGFINNVKKYFKHIFGGIIAGVITSVPFFAYFFLNDIPLGFLNQAQEVSSRTSLTATHGGELIGNDLFFYINALFHNIISNTYIIGIFVLFIFIITTIVLIYVFLDRFKDAYSKIANHRISIFNWEFSPKMFYALLVMSVVLVLVSFFTASLFSFVYSEIMLFAGLYLFAFSSTKIMLDFEGSDAESSGTFPYMAINVTMLAFFLSYLVFFSAHLTKADRYFTSMAPGFIFVMTLALEVSLNKIRGFNLKYLIPIIMILLMLFSTAYYISSYSDDNLAVCEKNTAKWIEDKDGIIFSDRGPIYTWLLQKEIPYPGNMTNATLLDQELLDANATYYIAMDPVNLTSYEPVKEFGQVTVYGLK